MKLYNTLNRQVEEIKPINPPEVTIYTCGPTVYDYPHIGNWFTFVRYDILVRTLKLSGYEPKWVMNITDVGHLVSDADEGEDKLEKGARREGKTAQEIADYYTGYFVEGLKRLNFTQPDHLPRATQHIPEQIALVKALEAKGYTYTIDDGVYYDTSKFPRYADFARLDLDEMQAGKRIEANEQKRNPSDFALWKFSPAGQQRDMEWDSPWGKGFPGWHLECSAMSMKYLGDTIDIHAGGIDHLPVHHTNEIAQSEAATGKTYANYWMHTNHIMVEGEKISKSMGNTITLEDVEARGISLAALRLHILESHYRSQSKFSWDSLNDAQNRLRGYQAMADLRWQPKGTPTHASQSFQNTLAEINKHLQNDLNTSLALSVLSAFSDFLKDTLVPAANIPDLKNFLTKIDELFGLQLAQSTDITADQKQTISDREAARAAKDWAKSDELRDQLAGQGIGLRDTPRGTVWYRL